MDILCSLTDYIYNNNKKYILCSAGFGCHFSSRFVSRTNLDVFFLVFHQCIFTIFEFQLNNLSERKLNSDYNLLRQFSYWFRELNVFFHPKCQHEK